MSVFNKRADVFRLGKEGAGYEISQGFSKKLNASIWTKLLLFWLGSGVLMHCLGVRESC